MVLNQSENYHNDQIPFDLNGIGNIFPGIGKIVDCNMIVVPVGPSLVPVGPSLVHALEIRF